MIDEEDLALVSRFRWHTAKGSDANGNKPYGVSRLYLHRLVMGFPPLGTYVDHIDGDSLNNTRANLRLCTHSQNQQNTRRRHSNSGYKNVFKNNKGKKWNVRFNFNGTPYNLGSFACKHEAALAYNKAISELAGEFAYLNVIKGEEAA